MTESACPPSPDLIFETLGAYQHTAILAAAIELDVFAHFGGQSRSAAELAEACSASPRGMRILCDCLVISGFLLKTEERYEPTKSSAAFLDSTSPMCIAGTLDILLNPALVEGFENFAEAVRTGSTPVSEEGTTAPEHPMWVTFARKMAPLMSLPAQIMADIVDVDADRPVRILDIAAGHGVFGLTFAAKHANVEVTALDWQNVLEVAVENAVAAGMAERYQTIAGSAFDADFGDGYDIVLLTNFLHHFDPPTCEGLYRKVNEALAEGGRAVALEFVPNADRVSPPGAAKFAAIMLASTPSGDAYTFADLEAMASAGGFARSECVPLNVADASLVISYK